MKPPANTAARKLRAKLQALAAKGVEGEAASATAKLTRLEAKYDFAAPDPDGADLFSEVVILRRGNQRDLTGVYRDGEIASFTKWAITAAFQVQTLIRVNRDNTFTLCAECAVESRKTLDHVSKVIRESFERLWTAFAELPGASERDARTFLRGLYDAMMHDERPAGQMLPPRTTKPPELRTRARKHALVERPALSLHPYEAGLALGGKIRIQIPIEQIVGDLKDAEKRARLSDTTEIAA